MASDFTYNILNKRAALANIVRMHIIDSCVSLQAQLFEKLLQEARATWPPLASTSSQLAKQCFTLVMRPSEETKALLAEKLIPLAERFPGHIYYGAENYHLTVFGLPDLDKNKLAARHFDRYLASHVCALKPVTMPVGGLSVIGNTIIFKVFDTSGNLLQFNKSAVLELTEELYGDGVDIAQMIGLHTELFWMTAARIGADAPPELFEAIAAQSDEAAGTVYFDTMEVLKTDQLFKPDQTKVIKSYMLGELN
jgi:hypothetical protein